MNRSVIIHGTVLSASLLAAYLVWTREPSTDREDEVSILSFHTLDRVLFESPVRKVEITRDKDDFGTYHWVRVETQRKKPSMARRPPMPRRPPVARPPGTRAGPARKALPPGPRPTPPPVRRPPPPAPRAKPPAPRAKPPTPKGPPSLAQDPKADPDKASATPRSPAPASPGRQPAKPPAKGGPAKLPPKGAPAKLPPAPAKPPIKRKPPKPKTVTDIKAFVGNKTAEELFETLANLPAARALGKQPKDKLKEFGLSESKSTLTIVSGSTTRKFVVGDRTYGNLDYYLLDAADKRVYVVRQDLIDQVKNAQSRLYAANLHDFTLSDVERVVASAGGKRKTLLQHDRTKARAAYWTDEGSADAKRGKDAYRTWIGKVNALRVSKYTTRDNRPDGLKEVARLEYHKGGDRLGFLTLFEQTEPAVGAKPAARTGMKKYYARTERTRVPAELYSTRAEEVIKSLGDLLKD